MSPFNRIAALIVITAFYAIYYTKMLIQTKKGIRTKYIGSRREKKLHRVETLMAVATYGIVASQLLSLIFGWGALGQGFVTAGFIVGLCGDLVFLAAVVGMRDSWRAGIPEGDKTKLVTRGIYRFSRNPAFLGFDLSYIGILLMLFNPLTLIFTLFAIVMLHLQILQEEKYMEATFGDEYLDYKRHTLRYLGRK